MEELFKATLLPILGGFIFILTHWWTRFVALRSSGEKLVLICAVVGIVLAILGEASTAAIKFGIEHLLGVPALDSLHRLRLEVSPYPMAQMSAMGLGWLSGLVLNKLPGWDRESSLITALADVGSPLELRLESARRDGKTVMLTLRSGRVYVGYVMQIVPPMLGPRHICILPIMSGHRSKSREKEKDGYEQYGRIVFTTFYEEIVKIILRLGSDFSSDEYLVSVSAPGTDSLSRSIDFNTSDMGVLVPIGEVHVATLFDPNVYAFLNRHRQPEQWDAIGLEVSLRSKPLVMKRRTLIKSRIKSAHRVTPPKHKK